MGWIPECMTRWKYRALPKLSFYNQLRRFWCFCDQEWNILHGFPLLLLWSIWPYGRKGPFSRLYFHAESIHLFRPRTWNLHLIKAVFYEKKDIFYECDIFTSVFPSPYSWISPLFKQDLEWIIRMDYTSVFWICEGS